MSDSERLKLKLPFLKFGHADESGVVRLCRFCPDPDGSRLQWFQLTDDETNLNGLALLYTKTEEYHGRCYDTGEFYSHAGELLRQLLKEAPQDATLATFIYGSSAGTKTFTDTVTVKFYGKKSEEAKQAKVWPSD